MRSTLIAILASLILTSSASAGQHHHGHCNRHCIARSQHHFKLRVIRPYRSWLGPTGACESGTGSTNLHVGLGAISRGGTYRGRYQFDLRSWQGAGGRGDPAAADWLEQAYRAVRWLKIAGNGAWPICGH